MLCQQTSPKRWLANVNMTPYYVFANSLYPVTMTTIRCCSILEFCRGIQSSSRPAHHQTSARHWSLSFSNLIGDFAFKNARKKSM